jgi:NAD(P)-dependent dehydrogenase (short-subunit alcohol dehydrogenase family)
MSTSFDLGGRIALVTGASSGLGDRFARVLAGHGARVVLAARRIERLERLRGEIAEAGGVAHVVPLDVTDPASIESAVAQAEREAGPIDILVNNSGVSNTIRLLDVQPADFDFVFDTNIRGAFFVAQAVARRMVERAKADPSREARIVNIASMAGVKALPGIGVYGMSKAAAIQMTRAMAAEWGRFNINVNAILPGYIRTEINEAHWETEGGRKLIAMTPRRRLGQPEDLDGTLLLLASSAARMISGSTFTVDDGFCL